MKIGARKKLEESFPDRKFTKEELRNLSRAIEQAGGRQKWLAKKGFIKLSKEGSMSVVMFDGMIGREIVKGIRYNTSIPYAFWQEVGFPQLDKYEFGINEGKKENYENLDNFVKDLGKTKKLL